MSDLVERLTAGTHQVEVSLRPERTVAALRAAIDRGCVHVRFTETRGGTELGIALDRGRSDLQSADFSSGTGAVHLVGTLTLDGSDVRCLADISLPDMRGHGRLERV